MHHADHILERFNGTLPNTLDVDWLLDDARVDLLKHVRHAYRLAVKMALDKLTYGESDFPEDDYHEDDGLDDVAEEIKEWEKDYYFGIPGSKEWDAHVSSAAKSHLVSIGKDEKEVPAVYTMQTLTLAPQRLFLGALNSEAVSGMWANMVMELYYFTNDDDERYSIQAHKGLLRNLAVSSAEPPLGYPVWGSGPIALAVW